MAVVDMDNWKFGADNSMMYQRQPDRGIAEDIAVVLRDDQSVFRRRLLLSSAPDISWFDELAVLQSPH